MMKAKTALIIFAVMIAVSWQPSPANADEGPEITKVVVKGYRIKTCSNLHEVITGRQYSLRVVTNADEGKVSITREKYVDGKWTLVRIHTRQTVDGAVLFEFIGQRPGKVRFKVENFSGYLKFKFVKPNWVKYRDGVRLKVPFYRQQHSLSCESASLRSALNYLGPNYGTDLEILKEIGIDSRPRSGNRWGDPEKKFVGSYNGQMMSSGYGVHATPVMRALNRTLRPCREAIEIKEASDRQIAKYLLDGFPVEAWHAHKGNTGIYKYNWYSRAGRRVTAWSVEHTWLVVGFRGSPSNPTHFYVHDPSQSSRGGGNQLITDNYFHSLTKYFAPKGRARVVVVR